jgi:hypothetical protein
MIPCRVCGRAAKGLYGWKSPQDGALVKADLCPEHARVLRAKTGVIVLKSHRKRKSETRNPHGVLA